MSPIMEKESPLAAPVTPQRCSECSQPARVCSDRGGFVVRCKDVSGLVCCQTARCDSEQEAVVRWVKMQGGRA